MDIEIETAEGVERTDALDAHIHDRLTKTGRRFGERITWVRVFVKDVNAGKGGVDKNCTMEARPERGKPVVVDAQNQTIERAVRDAAGKLEKAVEHRFARNDPRR